MRIKLLAATFGIFLAAGTAYAGPVPGGTDTDGDTVEDAFDNCTVVANAPQNDTDHNGCGDSCQQDIQCDFNADLQVGSADRGTLNMNFGNAVPVGTLGDCAGTTPADPPNGVVGTADRARLNMSFGNSLPGGAGPSGITTAQCDPTTCTCTP